MSPPPATDNARAAPAAQFERGLGAVDGDAVEPCYLDPRLAKGKRPGEIEMGKALCAALFKQGVTPVLTTWATIDQRLSFLIAEALAWETAYGGLDKLPTGRAKCKRTVHDPATNELVERDWPWEDWMWPMIRLGRQRKGKAAADMVKKEELNTTAAQHLAEGTVAKLAAQMLAVDNDEQRAEIKKQLKAARKHLWSITGGRRGVVKGKKARKSVKTEGASGSDSGGDGTADDSEESGSAGAEGAEATRKGRSSGVDAGIAALMQDARDAQAASAAALERLTEEGERYRKHEAEEAAARRKHEAEQAEAARQHSLELARVNAESQKAMMLGFAEMMAKLAPRQ